MYYRRDWQDKVRHFYRSSARLFIIQDHKSINDRISQMALSYNEIKNHDRLIFVCNDNIVQGFHDYLD